MPVVSSSAVLHGFKTQSINDGLRAIGESCNGVATGLWKVEGQNLKQQHVWFADTVSVDVQKGFEEATGVVPLSEDKLAIVKACKEGKPVFTHVDASPAASENSSPGWLQKFKAEMSLAVPVVKDRKPVGVLAMSTRDAYCDSDWRYQLMTETAQGLASELEVFA